MPDYSKKATPIAINFGDNDFGQTFVPVLLILHDLREVYDKDRLCMIINNLSYGCYLAYQHQWRDDSAKTQTYLIIKPDNIYVGEEVDEWLANTGMHNHSCWYIYHGSADKTVYTA